MQPSRDPFRAAQGCGRSESARAGERVPVRSETDRDKGRGVRQGVAAPVEEVGRGDSALAAFSLEAYAPGSNLMTVSWTLAEVGKHPHSESVARPRVTAPCGGATPPGIEICGGLVAVATSAVCTGAPASLMCAGVESAIGPAAGGSFISKSAGPSNKHVGSTTEMHTLSLSVGIILFAASCCVHVLPEVSPSGSPSPNICRKGGSISGTTDAASPGAPASFGAEKTESAPSACVVGDFSRHRALPSMKFAASAGAASTEANWLSSAEPSRPGARGLPADAN